MKRIALYLFLILIALAWACDDLNPRDDPVVRTDPAGEAPKSINNPTPSHLNLRVERERIDVCRRPYGLALSLDGGTLFVACPGENKVAAYDTELMEPLWISEPVNERVYRLIVDPRHNRLYGIAMSGRSLHVFNAKTGEIQKQMVIGQNISDFALVPTMDRMVITTTDPPHAALLNLAGNIKIDGHVSFPTPPGSLAMRQDGQLAAASAGVWRILTAGAKPVYEPLYLFDPTKAGFTRDRLGLGGTQARQGLFVRNGSILLVPGRQSATVSVFDVDARRLERTIQVGSAPEKLVVSPDGRWAFTMDSKGASSTRIDLSRREASGHVVLPGNPQDLAVAPDGAELYAVLPGENGEHGQIAVVDLRDLTVSDLIPVGVDPCFMISSHGGRRMFVSNFLSDSISMLE